MYQTGKFALYPHKHPYNIFMCVHVCMYVCFQKQPHSEMNNGTKFMLSFDYTDFSIGLFKFSELYQRRCQKHIQFICYILEQPESISIYAREVITLDERSRVEGEKKEMAEGEDDMLLKCQEQFLVNKTGHNVLCII